MPVAERQVFIRVSTRDADKAVRELRRLGIRGEASLQRIERVPERVQKFTLTTRSALNGIER